MEAMEREWIHRITSLASCPALQAWINRQQRRQDEVVLTNRLCISSARSFNYQQIIAKTLNSVRFTCLEEASTVEKVRKTRLRAGYLKLIRAGSAGQLIDNTIRGGGTLRKSM